MTLGAAGALLVGRRNPRRPAVDRVAAVDTTGAGDAFNGALAAPWPGSLARRMPSGGRSRPRALATTRVGAREGMPTAAELEAALAR